MRSLPRRMRAVVVDRAAPGGLAVRAADEPCPEMCEALVRVSATSLNRGEVDLALAGGGAGARPGWDFAGIIEAAAADGSGPPAGTRVAGLAGAGAWAELVAVPVEALARLPRAVSFTQAATLPVAGLTALHALGRGGLLAGKRVLVADATGDAGLFAVQIAHASSAIVTAAICNPEHEALIEEYGADHVVAGGPAAAAKFGPYHLVLAAAGGAEAAAAAGLLRPDGVSVPCGAAGAAGLPGAGAFCQDARSAGSHGFALRGVLRREPASEGLERLLALVEAHKVHPHVEVEGTWTDVAALAQLLLDRSFVGKVVLHLAPLPAS